ncbi:hypothetical protein D6201_06705 [Aurantiacibacter aquimixticola]|uniref:Uncharacterized protein n=1 Tax=Aurantiacibacter aquimixticola TaxID=1958945 RepID=A0A419RTH6_9SPHN|nr:hypothetical protein D6201_06705 [Aurantiacibacter aquimixticola]
MSEDPENLTLRHLRRLDEKLDRLLDDQTEVKQRLGSLEQSTASISVRIDRLDERVARIDKRLHLVAH